MGKFHCNAKIKKLHDLLISILKEIKIDLHYIIIKNVYYLKNKL